MPRVPRGNLSADLSAVFTNQLISADQHQHPADDPTLLIGQFLPPIMVPLGLYLIWFALHVIVNHRLTTRNYTYVYIAFLNTYRLPQHV